VSFTHFLRGPPTPLTDSRALSYSRLAADYLWLATAKTYCRPLSWTTEAVWCSQGECWRHQAASVIWASPGVERPDAWQINCWYRILHAHFTRTPTPGVCVSLSHDLQWGSVPAYGLSDRGGDGQTAPQTVVCPVLGTITKKSIGAIPIPPNTGKYWPIPNTPIPVSFEPYPLPFISLSVTAAWV